jgi:stage V sporulation protein AB
LEDEAGGWRMMAHEAALALVVLVGFAGGLAVGGGFVAFIVVLDIIPRLAQVTRTRDRVAWLEGAVVCGVVYWTLADFNGWTLRISPIGTALIGCTAGIFVGMLAAALTEVLNVLPILAKRLRLFNVLKWLLLAMVLGKVCGSLFDWIVYQKM